jgi:pentatricopeptide repeat protein
MIEALVSNGRTSDAWLLAQKMLEDGCTHQIVNTIIYSSILKGFANSKETDKVMAVYDEMRAHKVQPNTITFNTILNAFAHGGSMYRVPSLLEDMKAASPPVEPDIVTYSTIVKGFCNEGNLQRALRVLDDMKASGKHAPDEVMFNSLLSGCAREHRPDEALQLLEDMRKHNVPPSNYTLSMLVKLMGRCRRINEAFTMLEAISQEYGLQINIQVYTCLIQGCFNAGQASKAIALHEKITKEGLISDAMTYSVLVRGCLQAGLVDKAVELARSATGNGPVANKGDGPGLTADCFEELVTVLRDSKEHQGLLAQLKDCEFVANGKGGSRPERRDYHRGKANYPRFAA